MVLYTDGDSQELDHSEIIKHIKQAYKHLDFPHAHIQKKLAPTVDDMNSSVPTLDIYSLRAITQPRHPDLQFEEEDLSTEEIEVFINAIQSNATTPEKQALGHFTRRKLNTMDMWHDWQQGE